MLARLRHAPWEPAIFPLADDAGALLIGGPPLRDLHAAEAGVDVKDVPADAAVPAGADFACALDVVFSKETLAALAHAAHARPGSIVQAAIRRGTPLWAAAARMQDCDGDLRLPLWAGALAGKTAHTDGDAADAFKDAVVAAVCDDDGAVVVRVPPHGTKPVLEMPAVRKLGGRVRHWVNVLELSLAAAATRRLRLHGRSKKGDVDIHPTATVINSILGEGVRLEPHAAVIDCVVGDDVLVADHSVLHTCVIGDKCRTLVDTSLRRCVAMQDSTLSNLALSDVVIGRSAFITTGVATFGPLPGRDVVVDGRDTKRAVLGAAIGARCVLGSRALFQAGAALPPGLLVVARPEEAALKLDDAGLARATMIRGDRSRDA